MLGEFRPWCAVVMAGAQKLACNEHPSLKTREAPAAERNENSIERQKFFLSHFW